MHVLLNRYRCMLFGRKRGGVIFVGSGHQRGAGGRLLSPFCGLGEATPTGSADRHSATLHSMEETPVCCVCLDDRATDVRLLPCCGRSLSTTRVCVACLNRICLMGSGRCPACRAILVLGDAAGSAAGDGKDSRLTTRLLSLLWMCCDALTTMTLFLLGPLEAASMQALEAVFSRGPT